MLNIHAPPLVSRAINFVTHLKGNGCLVGLDLGDGIASREGIALLDIPLGDGAGFHGRGEGGHSNYDVIRKVGGHVPALSEMDGRYRGGDGASGRRRRRGEGPPAGRGRDSSGGYGSEHGGEEGKASKMKVPTADGGENRMMRWMDGWTWNKSASS